MRFTPIGLILAAALGCSRAPGPVLTSPPGEPAVSACVWVTSWGGDDVCGLEVPSGRSLGCVRTGPRPHGVAVSQDGSMVYVSNEKANTVTIVDARLGRAVTTVPVGATPNQLALTPDGRRVWVLNNADSSISIVDTKTNTVEKTIPSGRGPHIIVMNKARNAAVVTAEGDSSLELFDLTSFERVSQVPVYAWPRVLAVTADGTKAFLTIRWLNGALAVALGGEGPTGRVALGEPRFAREGKDAHGVALTPNGLELLITTQVTGVLTFVDSTTYERRAEMTVGHDPNWVAVTPDGRYAVVSNTGDDTVSVVDVADRRLIRSVVVGHQPKRLTTGRCPGAAL